MTTIFKKKRNVILALKLRCMRRKPKRLPAFTLPGKPKVYRLPKLANLDLVE